MSGKTLPDVLECLKNFDCENDTTQDSLSRIFDTCLKLTDLIENSDTESSSKIYQDAVKTGIKHLEKCTHMVNELDLFSSNETIEEVQTSSLKYLLLPALLGFLNLMKQSKELSERTEILQTSEVYFKDFISRCKNYELSKRKLINSYEQEILEAGDSTDIINKQSISDLNALRERKIQQFKLKKELKDREQELKPALEREDAEEYIREYYTVTLERWMLTAIEELNNVKSEKSILRLGPEIKESSNSAASKPKEMKPLKPIIITRNEVQKKVFGLGYPSIPVLTIDDFYRQRFEKMVKEHKNNSEKSLQDMAITGGNLSKEEEDIEKEMLMDKDDLEALEKARAWDEWKDDNPRGSGNRKNKG